MPELIDGALFEVCHDFGPLALRELRPHDFEPGITNGFPERHVFAARFELQGPSLDVRFVLLVVGKLVEPRNLFLRVLLRLLLAFAVDRFPLVLDRALFEGAHFVQQFVFRLLHGLLNQRLHAIRRVDGRPVFGAQVWR